GPGAGGGLAGDGAGGPGGAGGVAGEGGRSRAGAVPGAGDVPRRTAPGGVARPLPGRGAGVQGVAVVAARQRFWGPAERDPASCAPRHPARAPGPGSPRRPRAHADDSPCEREGRAVSSSPLLPAAFRWTGAMQAPPPNPTPATPARPPKLLD